MVALRDRDHSWRGGLSVLNVPPLSPGGGTFTHCVARNTLSPREFEIFQTPPAISASGSVTT